jgi:integrase
MTRRTLTDETIRQLKPKAKRYAVPDPKMAGLYVRVTPAGAKTFAAIARNPYKIDKHGKPSQVWHTIGSTDHYKIEEARELARAAIKAIKSGGDRTGPQSFDTVSKEWFKRHVEAKGLRSAREIRRYLDKHILPTWGGREFPSIRRGDVTKLLDTVEDNAGPVAADKVLAHLSKLFRWHASRHDDYSTPLVPGMRRSNPKDRARDRMLSDNELRAVWKQAEANGMFGAYVRLLLLTAQRREKVAAMRWQDIAEDGTWTIPTEKREKGNATELVLPQAALEIIKAQPRFEGNPYVFAGRGSSYANGYSKLKAVFVERLPEMPSWRLHDLRRTARSLMSRAGVRPDIAERVLGHAIQGVEGVYDRHSYRQEKAHALAALVSLIEGIVHPTDKVTRLRA